MNFDIGEILTRASQITWKHKVLWVFSMFPVLFSFLFVPVVFIPMFFIGPYSLASQRSIDQRYYLSLFGNTDLVLAILAILLYVVGTASSSLGILRIENGRKELAFRELLQDGLDYFWPVLGVTLLIGGTASLLLMLVFGCMTVVGFATRGLGLACLLPLLFFVYPAMLMAYSLLEQSQAAVVVHKVGVRPAISRGWALIRSRFWDFVRFSLVLYIGMFVLSLVFLLPLLFPFLFLFLVIQSPQAGSDLQALGWPLVGLSLALLSILALVQGIAMTFIRSAFMIIYLRLTRSTAPQTALQ